MEDKHRVITDCFVSASSGCHRYDYWNEQALFDGRSDTGWCTPSRTVPRPEFLDLDLGRVAAPSRIRMQARPIANWPGFPRSIRMLADVADDGWTELLNAKDIEVRGGAWWEGDLPKIQARTLRLEIDEIDVRPNGSYFLQFMQLEVLEEVEL